MSAVHCWVCTCPITGPSVAIDQQLRNQMVRVHPKCREIHERAQQTLQRVLSADDEYNQESLD